MDLLHCRLGPSGQATMHRLLHDNMATGIGQISDSIDPCDPCRLGKLTRPPHPAVPFDHHTTYALELVVIVKYAATYLYTNDVYVFRC